MPMSKKSSKGGRRPAWMNMELLAKLKWKKVYGVWKEEQATWEEFKNISLCREATRKAKVHLELNLARVIKDNRKGCFKYISSKWKTRENVELLLKEMGALVMEDTEKAELPNASVFTAKADPWASQSLKVREEAWRKEDLPLLKGNWDRDHLSKLDIHKSMGPDGMRP